MIDAAERRDTSCSPDRPPYTTATRMRSVIPFLLRPRRRAVKTSLCGPELGRAMPAARRPKRDRREAVGAFLGRRCGGRRRPLQTVDAADEQEDRECDDQEVDDGVHEDA